MNFGKGNLQIRKKSVAHINEKRSINSVIFQKKTRNDKLRLCINPIKITSIDVTIHVSPILRLFAIKFLFFLITKKVFMMKQPDKDR